MNAAFVSFSGGKDSTVVSDLVRKALGNPSIIHIFGNTTLEFPQTYEYIDRFKAANRKTPVLRAENKEQDFFNLCESFGPPSRSLRWCCTIFKTGFIGEKIKKTFDDRKTILTFYGIRRSESTSRSTYERSSEGRKISKQLVASPIFNFFTAIRDFYEKEGDWLKNTNAFMCNAGCYAGIDFMCKELLSKCKERMSFEVKTIKELIPLDQAGLLYRNDLKNMQGKEQRNTVYAYLKNILLRDEPDKNEYKF